MSLKKFLAALALNAAVLVFASTPFAAAAEKYDLRVGTYNIAGGKHPDIPKIAELMSSHAVEIAGLQEVDRMTERNKVDMLGEFVKTRLFSHAYFGKAIDFQGGEYGLGLVSTMPMTERSSVQVDSSGTDEQRIFQRVVFEKGGKKIVMYNTHLSWENIDIRTKQLQQLKAAVDADTVPYKIIVGDFNVDQRRDELDLFQNGYSMANGRNGVWYDTFNGVDDTMVVFSVDNILVSKNMEIADVVMVESPLSDHNLFYADIIFK